MKDGGERPVQVENFDVLIVGAGISGVGGAYHMTKQCPDMSFVVLETKDTFGGTWVTHRYPGIRSDSDLHTFGYRFKPWTGVPIATAEEILQLHGRGDRGERSGSSHPLPASHRLGVVEQRGEALDDRGNPGGYRRAVLLHCWVPVDVPGLLRP